MSLYDEGEALIYDYLYFNRDMELTNEFNGRVEKEEYISDEEQSVYDNATTRLMQYNAQLVNSSTNIWERYAEKNQQYNDYKAEYSLQATDDINSVDAVTGRIPEMNNGQNVASGNGVSAPSGEESYYRQAQELHKEHPEWSLEQITNKMSEIVWNNNYKALINDIANSRSPEEREQKIREFHTDIESYKASGIDTDGHIKYLRDTQGMGTGSILNNIASVMGNYSYDGIESQYINDPRSFAGTDITGVQGISPEKRLDYEAQKRDAENKLYESRQHEDESLTQYVLGNFNYKKDFEEDGKKYKYQLDIGGYEVRVIDDSAKQHALLRAKVDEYGQAMLGILPWVGTGGFGKGVGVARRVATEAEKIAEGVLGAEPFAQKFDAGEIALNIMGPGKAPNPGSLSNVETRKWYLEQETKIADQIDSSLPLKQQAEQAVELRNQYRTQAREAMADRELANQLNITDPNKTVEQLIAEKQAKGLTGDDVWQDIIDSSMRSRKSVNKSLGLE